MASPNINFVPGSQIHLLRGQSIQLVGQASESCIQFNSRNPKEYFTKPDNTLSCVITFSFDVTKALDLGIQIQEVSIMDSVLPDIKLTTLVTENSQSKIRLNNFIVYVEVTDTSLKPTDEKYKQKNIAVVHIHEALLDFWITPSILNLYKDKPGKVHFRLLFDQHIMADFEHNKMLRNIIFPSINIEAEPDTDSLEYRDGSISQRLRDGQLDNDIPPTNSTMSFKLHAFGNTFIHILPVKYIDIFNKTDELKIDLVPGFSAGKEKLIQVPNFLFVSEGFTVEDKTYFDKYISEYVNKLFSNKISSPFNYFKGKINFWKLFIPSAERGISDANEYIVYPKSENIYGTYRIPDFLAPDTTNVLSWSLSNLLYSVSLPTPEDAELNSNELKTKWTKNTKLTILQIDQLIKNEKLIKNWKKCAFRKFAEIKNTAFGISINEYPIYHQQDHLFDMIQGGHMGRQKINDFFRAILNSGISQPGYLINLADQFLSYDFFKKGKDYENVIFLLNNHFGRENNANGLLFANVNSGMELEFEKVEDSQKVKVKTHTPDTNIPLSSFIVLTHEICHSLELGDEYAERMAKQYIGKPAKDVQSNFAIGNRVSLNEFANLQPVEDLVDHENENALDPRRIKWRYHRIKVCGLVDAAEIQNDKLVLNIPNEQLKTFNVDGEVFLRKKALSTAYYFVEESLPHVPVAIIEKILLNYLFIGRYKVVSLSADQKELTAVLLLENNEGFNPVIPFQGGTDDTTSNEEGNSNSTPGDENEESNESKFRIQVKLIEKLKPDSILILKKMQGKGTVHQTATKSDGSTVSLIDGPFKIDQIEINKNQMILDIQNSPIIEAVLVKSETDKILAYQPIAAGGIAKIPSYNYSELISPKVFRYLLDHPTPFNTNKNGDEIIQSENPMSRIPHSLVPCCTSNKNQIIGLYAGGAQYHSKVYHPSNHCLMNHFVQDGKYVELCAVCRYTLVNYINPLAFKEFDDDYMKRKIYPE